MRILRAVALLTLILAISSMSPADQGISLGADPRLAAKVDLAVACEPLSYLAGILQKASGARITARATAADLNVTIYAKQVSVADAMRRVALLFGCNWEVSGDTPGKRRYALYRPLRKIQEAGRLCDAETMRKERQFRGGIEDGIKLVNGDKDALQAAFDRDPARTAEDIAFKDTLQALGCFSARQRAWIWDSIAATPSGTLTIPFGELPAGLQQRFRNQQDEIRAQSPGAPGSDGIEQRGLIISRGGGFGSPRIDGLPPQSRIAFFGLTGLGGSAGLGNVNYGGDRAVREYELNALQQAGVDTSGYRPPKPDQADTDSTSKRVRIQFADQDDAQKPSAPGVEEATAVKGAKQPRWWHSLAEILEAASRQFGVSITADDYLCRTSNTRSTRTTFAEGLDETLRELEREFGYEAVKLDGKIGLRSRTWYLDERGEIPKRLILRWNEARTEQGELGFKDYMEIASALNCYQLEGLSHVWLDGDNPFIQDADPIGNNLGRLRLCSMFTASQMSKAMDDGLPVNLMTAAQQQMLAQLLTQERPTLSEEEFADCGFALSSSTVEQIVSGEPDGLSGQWKTITDTVAFTYIYGQGDMQKFEMQFHFRSQPLDRKPGPQPVE